jgi:TusA-related sulfurtransferase
VAGNQNPKAASIRYQSIRQNDIPSSRRGKHAQIVEQLLRHLEELEPGTALKVALASLPATKANIRSALNRATHKKGLRVATSSDSRHFYIWKVNGKSGSVSV